MQKQTVSQYIKTLQILHMAIAVGIIMFTAVAAGVVLSGTLVIEPMLDKTTALILGGAGFALPLVASRFIFSKKLTDLRTRPLLEKTKGYRTICIVRCALLDAAAIIAVILVFLNGYLELLVFPALVVVYLLSLYPTRKKILNDLQPDYKEMGIWDNPDAVVGESTYTNAD